jgi:hypothetical protein
MQTFLILRTFCSEQKHTNFEKVFGRLHKVIIVVHVVISIGAIHVVSSTHINLCLFNCCCLVQQH